MEGPVGRESTFPHSSVRAETPRPGAPIHGQKDRIPLCQRRGGRRIAPHCRGANGKDSRIGGVVATMLVLGRQGYETAVQGKNEFACLVERSRMAAFDSPEFWNTKV